LHGPHALVILDSRAMADGLVRDLISNARGVTESKG
jgi:hypothetical protein